MNNVPVSVAVVLCVVILTPLLVYGVRAKTDYLRITVVGIKVITGVFAGTWAATCTYIAGFLDDESLDSFLSSPAQMRDVVALVSVVLLWFMAVTIVDDVLSLSPGRAGSRDPGASQDRQSDRATTSPHSGD